MRERALALGRELLGALLQHGRQEGALVHVSVKLGDGLDGVAVRREDDVGSVRLALNGVLELRLGVHLADLLPQHRLGQVARKAGHDERSDRIRVAARAVVGRYAGCLLRSLDSRHLTSRLGSAYVEHNDSCDAHAHSSSAGLSSSRYQSYAQSGL